MNIVEVHDLYKEYGKGETSVKAINHISFHVEKGEFLAIVGTSGSGKSTLLNLTGGLDRANGGKIIINGREITGMTGDALTVFRRENIGFIFQEFNLVTNLDVKKNILLPMKLAKKKFDKQFFQLITTSLGLEDKLDRYPSQLSGGQQQRVAIARALYSKPAIILADEPTGSLDSKTTEEVLQLLKASCKKFHQTLVMITHNDNIAKIADKVIRIEDGKIVAERRS